MVNFGAYMFASRLTATFFAYVVWLAGLLQPVFILLFIALFCAYI